MLNASGTLTKTYDYDAYGNELSRDLNDANPFRYCGEYYDTETGFIYLRARYYDPNIGRFISKDSHWNVGNMIYGDNQSKAPQPNINAIKQSGNLYAYCMNNPMLYKDYSGEEVIIAITLIGLGLGAFLGGLYGHQVAKSKGYSNSDGWDYYKYILGGGLVGGTLGGIAAWEMGTIASLYISATGAIGTAATLADTATSATTEAVEKAAPIIGNKLEYIFGNATGNSHNIERSHEMLKSLASIGIYDNEEGREYIMERIMQAYYQFEGVVDQKTNAIIREIFIHGEYGNGKLVTVWRDERLLTVWTEITGKLITITKGIL